MRVGSVRARLYVHEAAEVRWEDVHCIFPDELAGALWEKGKAVWRHAMFGGHSEEWVGDFWSHCRQHCEWAKSNVCCNYPRPSRLVPLSLYGDNIAAYKGSETGSITVLGWTSDLAFENKPMLRYFPIACYSEYMATEWTHDDIMGPVAERLQAMFDVEMIHPWSTAGYMFMASSLQGDLKFIRDQYRLHDYRSKMLCSLCGVMKSNADVSKTLGGFAENAGHVTTQPDLTAFLNNRA